MFSTSEVINHCWKKLIGLEKKQKTLIEIFEVDYYKQIIQPSSRAHMLFNGPLPFGETSVHVNAN